MISIESVGFCIQIPCFLKKYLIKNHSVNRKYLKAFKE